MKELLVFFAVSLSIVSLLSYIPENQTAFAEEIHIINIPTGAADSGAAYFWQVESTGNTNGEIAIQTQDTVKWMNADSAAHTVTSGNPTDGADNIFDSSLFGPGESFSYQFTNDGKFDYYCIVHPWMLGVVTVQATSGDITGSETQSKTKTMMQKSKFPFSETAVIVIPLTGDNQDCAEKENCFLPMNISVEKDTLVTWYNFDDEPRSILSGNTIDGHDGIFASGTINPNESFSYRFETQTIREYYDILRPWETGTVTVTSKIIDRAERMTLLEGMSNDGTITVEFEAMNPTEGQAMGIHAKFIGGDDSLIENINYDLTAMQNGMDVLTLDNNHSHAGIDEHWTDVLISDDPVDIKITILGIGLPGEESTWTGPKGDIIMFNVVPEFGTIAVMILSVAIISIVAISTKSRLVIR